MNIPLPPVAGTAPAGDCLEIDCAGETLYLHHDRAIFWPRRRLLLVADLHLGKEYVFGRAGLAVPGGSTQSDLERLGALVRYFDAGELVVLGDFSHAPPSGDESWLDAVSLWLDSLPAALSIVAGNHDRPATRERLDRRIRWYPEERLEPPFLFQHDAAADTRGYGLGGHLHPAIRLSDAGDRLRLPVFWFREDYAVLPAFGTFTGAHNIRPAAHERVFALAPGAVVALPA